MHRQIRCAKSKYRFAKDSIESKSLTSSLNDFLISAQKPNKENKFVFESEAIETFILLDEINGIEKSGKFKDDFSTNLI